MTVVIFRVHDMIETPGFQGDRLYTINGVHLGALGQEGVVELESLDKLDPGAHGKRQLMLVPLEMLTAGIRGGIFKHTAAECLG